MTGIAGLGRLFLPVPLVLYRAKKLVLVWSKVTTVIDGKKNEKESISERKSLMITIEWFKRKRKDKFSIKKYIETYETFEFLFIFRSIFDIFETAPEVTPDMSQFRLYANQFTRRKPAFEIL